MESSKIFKALADLNGATFIGITTKTTPVLKGGKKNPMQGRVSKITTNSNVMAFQNKNINGYEAMVKRRLIAENKDPASFVLSERAWGTRIPNLPIVEHTKDGVQEFYLEVIFLRCGDVSYTLGGQPIAKHEIIGLPDATAGEQGGLDDKVIVRTYAFSSITELTINGVVHS